MGSSSRSSNNTSHLSPKGKGRSSALGQRSEAFIGTSGGARRQRQLVNDVQRIEFKKLLLIEPRVLEGGNRQGGDMQEGQRIAVDLRNRLVVSGVGFVVEDMDRGGYVSGLKFNSLLGVTC